MADIQPDAEQSRPNQNAPKDASAKKRKRHPWEVSKGWQAVNVGDSLLLGASEGGFCGLEELTPDSHIITGGSSAAASEGQDVEVGKKKAAASRKASKKTTGKEGSAPAKKQKSKQSAAKAAEQLQQLEAQLSELQAKKKQLKATLKKGSTPIPERKSFESGADEEADEGAEKAGVAAEKPLNSKQRKKLKRAAHLAARRGEIRKAARKEKRQGKRPAEGDLQEVEGEPGGGEGAAGGGEPAVDVGSWKPFELEEEIEAALASLGFSEPTPIQTECLPSAIRDRRDVIGAAQTGSGKTLAFGLPIIQALLEERKQQALLAAAEDQEEIDSSAIRLRALILAPTRELALQVCDHLQAVAKPCGIWVVPIVGGIAAAKQERLLKRRPQIVVATPGRLWELMREGDPHLTDMSQLAFLVLDEADRMVQQGHFEELSRILDFIPRPEKEAAHVPVADEVSAPKPAEGAGDESAAKRRKLQTFVFSATLTLPESLRRRVRKGGGGASGSVTLEALMDRIPFREKPKIADLTSSRRLADKVTEACIECSEEDRDERLYYILTQHPGRTLVFANAISAVRRLAALLRLLQLPVAPLHASMQQRQRLKALDKFKSSEDAILVATDVAARGLDIQGVTCVVHYQIPAAVDVYVHRCGRTARAAAEGISVALITPKESARFSALLKALEREEPPHFPIDANLLPAAKARVRLATRLDDVMRSSSKAAAHKSWEAQAAEAAGIDLSDEEDDRTSSRPAGQSSSAQAEKLKQELAALLQEPLQPRYSRRYFAGNPSASLVARTAAEKKEADESSQQQQQQQAQAVFKAVEHARQLAKAHKNAGEAEAKQVSKKQRKAPRAARSSGSKGAVKPSGRSRFVVIPGAVSRGVGGPNALEALRNKLNRSS